MRRLELRRLRGPTPVEWIAIALFAVTVVAVVVWALTKSADDWMTNVGTSAFFGAVTITVIDWAIREQARRRIAPRVGPVLDHIHFEFMQFVEIVAFDYATTHDWTYETPPRPLLEVLDHWLIGEKSADLPHIVIAEEGETLIALGIEFVDQVVQYDASDRDVLDPDFVAAIRRLRGAGRHAQFWANRKLPAGAPPALRAAGAEKRATLNLVYGAREFGDVLRGYLPEGAPFELSDQVLQMVEEYRAEVLAARR